MSLPSLGQQEMRVNVLSGAARILERLPSLHAAAQRWGQAAEAAELPYLLSVPVVPERRPLLVLLEAQTLSPVDASNGGELLGAVLLFAYGARVLGERLLAHPDRSGRRCVFGPERDRTIIAVIASRAMLERGAAYLRFHYQADGDGAVDAEELESRLRKQRAIASLHMLGAETTTVQYELRNRTRRVEFALEPELDEALKRLGKRTRRNLRAATRRCARDMGARFEMNPALSEDELGRLNRACTHPVRPRVLRWRYRVLTEHPGAFVAGLRSASGEWMAVAGGRRAPQPETPEDPENPRNPESPEDAVTLDWQMNVKRFAPYSVSLVMRGHLMAHFGREGVRSMRFEGGTTHALAKGFRTATVYTLQMKRPTFALRAFERGMTAWLPGRAVTRTLFESARNVHGILD